MTAKRGWRLRKVRKAWVGMVAIPGAAKYRSQSFTGPRAKSDAAKWAENEASKQRLNLVARQVHRTATKVLIDDYLAELRSIGRSASYQHDRRVMLGRLTEAVGDLAAPGASKAIETLLTDMPRLSPAARLPDGVVPRSRPVMPATRNKYLVAFRSLCQFAIEREALALDPTRTIKPAKVPERMKPQFTIAELRTMAKAIDHPYHPLFVVRAYMGLRSQEVAKLEWPSLDVEGRCWQVIGKGDKQRLAHLPEEGLTLIELHRRAGRYVCTDEQRRNQHPSRQIRDLDQFCRDCGIERRNRTPHSLRHCYAGLMTATGQPSLLLGAHMGHTQQETTAGYTKLATRYLSAVQGWKRGQVELLSGWCEAWPRVSPASDPAGSG